MESISFEQLNTDKNLHNISVSGTCLLGADDVQCGCVFLNESGRLLKFHCIFCQCTYDNIHNFCDHVANHLNVAEETEFLNDEETAAQCIIEIKAEDEETTMHSMVIDESEEIAEEVAQEMLALSANNCLIEDVSNCSEFFACSEENELSVCDSSSSKTNTSKEMANFAASTDCDNKTEQLDFESLIDSTVQLPSTSKKSTLKNAQTAKRMKTKKVTTVKVIASKNRIGELYAKIKQEVDKRTSLKDNSEVLNDREPPAAENFEEISSSNIEDTHGAATAIKIPSPPAERQIIGETLITLLSADHQTLHTASTSTTDDNASDTSTRKLRNHNDLVCPACGKWFHSSYRLTAHKRSHYLESNNNIKLAHRCSDCDSLFNTAADMKEHLHRVHYPNGFICKICGKKLFTLNLLETHARKVHLTRPFNCNVCQKNYSNRIEFDDHVRSHTITTRTFRCHMCGRKYPTDTMLKTHLNRHKERKPQSCVVCGKETLRITQHMKIHVPRPKRVVKCTICSKTFNFNSGLTTHMRNFHKLPVQSDDQNNGSVGATSLNSSTPSTIPKSQTTVGPVTRSRNKNRKDHIDDDVSVQNDEHMMQKEEEAKRVIVELIQNVTYSSFLPENFETGDNDVPPAACEETITAINTIAND